MSDRKEYLTNEIWHKENVLKASRRAEQESKNSDGLRELFGNQVKKLTKELAELRTELRGLTKGGKNAGKSKKLSKRS